MDIHQGVEEGILGGRADERLRWKEPLHSLEVELQRDYGLSVIASRALHRRIEEFLDTYVGTDQTYGQIRYPAVVIGEKAGKPLKYCLTVPVRLTVLHAADAEVLHGSGSPALRRARLARLASEAHRQGAVLSHEDLSLLLAVDLSTVRRMVAECAAEGLRPPTRGSIDDIGPTVSHKEVVLRLYFCGLLPQRIAARTGHGLGSVERYLMDFARVAELVRRGVGQPGAVRILGMSPALVGRYIELLKEHDRPEHRPVFDRLLRRFGPIEADADEVSDG